MSTIRIPLNSRKYPGLYATIDEADVDLVSGYVWVPTSREVPSRPLPKTQYAKAYASKDGVRQRNVFMHRLIMQPGDGMYVDHIDGDGLNNTRANLRIVSAHENRLNLKMYASNTSGYKGVSLHKKSGLWQARVNINGKVISAGYSTSKEEAARMYDRLAIEVHGEFARTNRMLGLLKDDE